MTNSSKESALRRIRESRQALIQGIQGLSEAEMTGPRVEGAWTIKDVLGHIVAWEQACLEPLECYQAGGPFQCDDISDHDAWNAAQAARRRETPTQAILEEMEEVRRRLLAAAGQCTQGQWAQKLHLPWGEEAGMAEMLNGLAWHEEEHLKSILAWRNK